MFITDVTYRTWTSGLFRTEHVVSAVFQFGQDRVPLIASSDSVPSALQGLHDAAERELKRRFNESIKLTVVGA
jgi:hypothetical protein